MFIPTLRRATDTIMRPNFPTLRIYVFILILSLPILFVALIMTQLKNTTWGFWVGGRRGSEVEPWKWVNNDPWQYTNWANNFPDSSTVVSALT